ncbi:hypothetical protein A4R26_06155 [Niastella populi]|uniref:Uncharacterized protein n=1 Tax=Niastella populi TaxID=550983 RepID=A0A1V9F5L8_9BACT|nr:hypothetical protein A4R26_06155 [Niastella populi]
MHFLHITSIQAKFKFCTLQIIRSQLRARGKKYTVKNDNGDVAGVNNAAKLQRIFNYSINGAFFCKLLRASDIMRKTSEKT